MDQGRARDVQLGATNDDAVIVTFNNSEIKVGVILLMGFAAAVTLGVGDQFGRAQIVVPGLGLNAPNVVREFGIDRTKLIFDPQ